MSEPEQAADSPRAFSDAFRRKIALGKYTGWAVDLSEDQLIGVLWAIGEYGRRWRPVLECLARHEGEFHPADGYPRAQLGLQLLAAMADGNGFTVGQVTELVQAVVRKWRAELGIPED